MIKNIKERGLLTSRIGYYISNAMLIFLVAVVMILSLSFVIYFNAREHTEEMYHAELKNGVQSLSEQLKSTSNILMTSDNDSVIDFIYTRNPMKPSDVVDLLEMRDYIKSFSGANSLFADMVVYFPRSGTVISRLATYNGIDKYIAANRFSNSAWIECASDPEKLQGIVTCQGFQMVDTMNQTKDIAFVVGVPFAFNTAWSADDVYAWLLMDVEQLSMLFGTIYDEKYCFTISDRSGNQLFSLGSDREPLGKHITVPDSIIGISVSVWIHSQELLTSMLWTLSAYILLMILVCFGATVFCALRAARPMNAVAEQLLSMGLSDNAKTINFVREGIDQMDRNYRESLDTIKRFQGQYRDLAIDRCLFSQLQQEVPELPSSFAVAYGVVPVTGEEQNNILSLLVGQHLASELASNTLLHNLDDHSFILILPAASTQDVLLSRLTSSIEEISRSLNVDLRYGLSDVYSGSAWLRVAFDEARNDLAAKRKDGYVPKLSDVSTDMSFDTLQRLYNSLLERNQADAEAMLSECLYARTPLDLDQRYSAVRMMIVCAYHRMCPSGDAAQFEAEYLGSFRPYLPIGQLNEELGRAVRFLCAMEISEDGETSAFVNCVLTGYTDFDFGVQSIMDALGLPEKGVYDICKRVTGKSPAAYIQQVRLENASSLLRNTEQSIGEICEQSGYNTLSAFYKAFKRVYGVTPTQYRRTFIDDDI